MGMGINMRAPAATELITPERIKAYFSPTRIVYGPATKAPIAIVYRPNERSPATKAVEYPNDKRYKLNIA